MSVFRKMRSPKRAPFFFSKIYLLLCLKWILINKGQVVSCQYLSGITFNVTFIKEPFGEMEKNANRKYTATSQSGTYRSESGSQAGK